MVPQFEFLNSNPEVCTMMAFGARFDKVLVPRVLRTSWVQAGPGQKRHTYNDLSHEGARVDALQVDICKKKDG